VKQVLIRLVLLLLVVAVLGAGGYYVYQRSGEAGGLRAWIASLTKQQSAAPATPGQQAGPPPEVGVFTVQPAEIPLPVEYAARVAGFRDVEIRARVSGLLLSREFEEGARVNENQVLFRIDPATYQVALSRAEAQAQQGQATLRQAEDNFRRIDELFRRGVATDKQRDDALAARDQARASVQLAEAEIESAKLNLGYTTITAPVGGVTALLSPPVGTLVQAQQTLLATVTQLDPAYVNFSFTDEEGQQFRELNQKRAKPISEKDLTAELHYGNGTTYPQVGRIDTSARRVDPQTGTIQARAIFPNPDGALLPGQFVRVVIRGVTLPEAIVIPNQAIVQGPQGPSVYVVGENGNAQVRTIRVGQQVEGGGVVQNGLQAGDRVVVEGIIRVRPGAPVKPVPVTPAPQTAQAAAPEAPAALQTGSTTSTSAEPAQAPAAEPARAQQRARKPASRQAGARP
jgi:membrane fusion protein, multidrug efflux system